MIKKYSLAFVSLCLIAVGVSFLSSTPTHAAPRDNGYLIDDSVYYNYSSMSESQINDFINSFPKSCLRPQNYPSGLSWATFREPLSYSTYTANDVSPARIIWKAAQLYKINPQVLLTTLEKEQSLISGSIGCSPVRYNSAMGYNCPDGSENALRDYPDLGVSRTCVAQSGNVTFARQVNRAGWQLSFDGKRANGDLDWMDDGNSNYGGRMTQGWRSRTIGGVSVYYDGYTTIDGVSVYLQNGATAALYNYTPHFNSFNTIFTNWFGSPTGSVEVSNINIENQPFTDKSTSVSFTVKNNYGSSIPLGKLVVAVRKPDGSQADFKVTDDITLASGATYTYTSARILGNSDGTPEGDYKFFISRYSQGAWYEDAPFATLGNNNAFKLTKIIQKQPLLSSGLAISQDVVHKNQLINASFSITNPSSLPITISQQVVAVRDKSGKSYDFPASTAITLAPGKTYTYSQARSIDSPPNDLTAWVSTKRDGYDWSDSFPASTTNDTVRRKTISVKDSVTLITPLSFSSNNILTNDTVMARFTVKNFSTQPVSVGKFVVAVRDRQQITYDFPVTLDITLLPGQEYTYQESQSFKLAGIYTTWISNYKDPSGWSNTYPDTETSSIQRSASITIDDSVQLASPLSISADPDNQNSIVAKFTVKNFGTKPVAVGQLIAAVRSQDQRNYDFPLTSNIELASGGAYTYSEHTTLPKNGTYRIWISTKRDTDTWSDTYPGNGGTNITRTINYNLDNIPKLTSGLSTQVSGRLLTVSFTIRNFSTKTEDIGDLVVAVRNSKDESYDLPIANNITLAPGQSYVYTKSISLPSTDAYTAWISNRKNNLWNNTNPISQDSSLVRLSTFNIN